MEQCRGGCSHEMVKSPATATTMAYPTEEEKRSYRRADDVNGDGDVNHDDVGHADDDDGNNDSDGVVRSNGNREERSRDFGTCRVCGFNRDRDFESCSDHSNICIKDDVTHVSNSSNRCNEPNDLMRQLLGVDVNNHSIHININLQDWVPRQPTVNQEPRLNAVPLNTNTLHAALIRQIHGYQEPAIAVYHSSRSRRKQSYPQRMESEDLGLSAEDKYLRSLVAVFNQSLPATEDDTTMQQVKLKSNNVQTGKMLPRLFKCILSPRLTAERGIKGEGYQTEASLLFPVNYRTEELPF